MTYVPTPAAAPQSNRTPCQAVFPMLPEVLTERLPVCSATEISALGGKWNQVTLKVLLIPKWQVPWEASKLVGNQLSVKKTG